MIDALSEALSLSAAIFSHARCVDESVGGSQEDDTVPWAFFCILLCFHPRFGTCMQDPIYCMFASAPRMQLPALTLMSLKPLQGHDNPCLSSIGGAAQCKIPDQPPWQMGKKMASHCLHYALFSFSRPPPHPLALSTSKSPRSFRFSWRRQAAGLTAVWVTLLRMAPAAKQCAVCYTIDDGSGTDNLEYAGF